MHNWIGARPSTLASRPHRQAQSEPVCRGGTRESFASAFADGRVDREAEFNKSQPDLFVRPVSAVALLAKSSDAGAELGAIRDHRH